MVTTTANPPTKTDDKAPDFKAPEVTDKDVKDAVKYQIVAEAVPVNTSEDAAQAYLRGLISEDTLRQVVGRHGQVSHHWATSDQLSAYGKELPDDVIWDKPNPKRSHDEFVKSVEEKQAQRKEAMEDALKDAEDPLEKKALKADLERFYPSKSAKTTEK